MEKSDFEKKSTLEKKFKKWKESQILKKKLNFEKKN